MCALRNRSSTPPARKVRSAPRAYSTHMKTTTGLGTSGLMSECISCSSHTIRVQVGYRYNSRLPQVRCKLENRRTALPSRDCVPYPRRYKDRIAAAPLRRCPGAWSGTLCIHEVQQYVVARESREEETETWILTRGQDEIAE